MKNMETFLKVFRKKVSSMVKTALIMDGVIGFCNVTEGYYQLQDVPPKKKNKYFREIFDSCCPLRNIVDSILCRWSMTCCEQLNFEKETGKTVFCLQHGNYFYEKILILKTAESAFQS